MLLVFAVVENIAIDSTANSDVSGDTVGFERNPILARMVIYALLEKSWTFCL